MDRECTSHGLDLAPERVISGPRSRLKVLKTYCEWRRVCEWI